MKDRIRQLMEAQHMNQQTFASYTGIGTASLSSIFTGRTRPTLNHVDAILNKFPNVNPMWLLKGTGGMMLPAGNNNSDTANDTAQQEKTGTTEATTSAIEDTSREGMLCPSIPSTKPSRTGASQSSDNLSAKPNLFNTSPTNITQRNGTSSSALSKTQSFHLEPQQKVIQIQRHITEIRVFYDDQTWESFVPKK